MTFTVEVDVPVPMRDGIALATNVWRPDGPGPFPALLVRTPYGKDDAGLHGNPKLPDVFALVGAGYAVVAQDVRGTSRSPGTFVPHIHECLDGLDTLAWLAGQPWCDGKIGMWGGSYMGFTQWQAAPHDAPGPPRTGASQSPHPAAGGTAGHRTFHGTGGADMSAMEEIVDRTAISDVVAGLAHAQDDRDWDALRRLFADAVTLDLSTHYHGRPPTTVTAAELVELARTTLAGFDCTHHTATNLVVRLSGDEAECRTHMIAYHHVPADPGVVDHCTMRGYWRLGLCKLGGSWLIHHWAVMRTAPWEGSPDVYALAAARRESADAL
jgi:X-Pro dipeptidyl-peptidase-like protein/SnoaL-like protein